MGGPHLKNAGFRRAEQDECCGGDFYPIRARQRAEPALYYEARCPVRWIILNLLRVRDHDLQRSADVRLHGPAVNAVAHKHRIQEGSFGMV